MKDYRMTRANFGVPASCFAANMAVKQNATELVDKSLLHVAVVHNSFYVDNSLTGADDAESVITLQRQLQDLFTHGGFMLKKWNSSEPLVLQAILPELLESKKVHSIPGLKMAHQHPWTRMGYCHKHILCNDLQITAIRNCDQKDANFWYCEGIWCLWVACSGHRQYENSSAESLGGKCELGRSSVRSNPEDLATVELQTPLSCLQECAPLILPKKCPHCVSPNSWVQQRIWRCIHWSCIPQNGWLSRCSSHFANYVQDERLLNQEIVHTSHLLWCSSACQATALHQGNIPGVPIWSVCLDWQHNCLDLVDSKPVEIKG